MGRKSRLELYVLVPGVLQRVARWAQDYGDLARFQGLETIMGRGNRHALPTSGVDATLCWLFGLVSGQDLDLPLAALRRHGFSAAGDTGFWLCADPVYLRADITHVFLTDGGSLNITSAEADDLAGLLRAHFADAGRLLEVASPACWHLRAPSAAAIKTRPLRDVIGGPIEERLPSGAQAGYWRAMMNEVQMLFHDADVNRQRQQRGAPVINGLWIWGAGELPASQALRSQMDALWSDDPVAAGLGRLADIDTRPRPRSLESMMASNPRGAHLVSLDALLAPAGFDDFAAWRERLQALESDWFEPMLERITTGAITACHIYDCAGQQFSFTRAHRCRRWRGLKPLQAYAQNG